MSNCSPSFTAGQTVALTPANRSQVPSCPHDLAAMAGREPGKSQLSNSLPFSAWNSWSIAIHASAAARDWAFCKMLLSQFDHLECFFIHSL